MTKLNARATQLLNEDGYCRVGASTSVFLIKWLRRRSCYFVIIPYGNGTKRSKTYLSVTDAMKAYTKRHINWISDHETP